MKKLIISSWLMGLVLVFGISCQDDPVHLPGPDTLIDFEKITGNWTAAKVEYIHEDLVQDVTHHFDEFKVNICSGESCCNINGCNSFVSANTWQRAESHYFNYLTDNESGNVILFKVVGIEGSSMTAHIETRISFAKLFPGEEELGYFRISFIR